MRPREAAETQERQWITARRSELDALAKQLQEVRIEREELAVGERMLNRLADQARAGAGAEQIRAIGERLGLDTSMRSRLAEQTP